MRRHCEASREIDATRTRVGESYEALTPPRVAEWGITVVTPAHRDRTADRRRPQAVVEARA